MPGVGRASSRDHLHSTRTQQHARAFTTWQSITVFGNIQLYKGQLKILSVVPAGTIAAVAFPPGAGNAGGVDMAILQRQNTEKATTDHLWRYG